MVESFRKLTAAVAVSCLCFSPARAAEFTAVTVFESGRDGYNIYRIPAIVKAANGDLLAFCEAREGGDASEIDLVLKRSSDSGKTWQAQAIVQDDKDFRDLFDGTVPPISIGNPAPVVDRLDPKHPGRVWLPFTLENDRVFVTYSDDHGKSWSTRREITSDVKRKEWGWYATGPVHSIQLLRGKHKGRLVVPADHRFVGTGQGRGIEGAQAIVSDDHGATWRLGAIDETYDDEMKANETTVVELNDGRLYFNTRNQNGTPRGTRGGAYSTDGGLTFDRSSDALFKTFVPEPLPFDPPVVQCALLRGLSRLDGDDLDLILFSGPDDSGPTGKGRSDLRLRFSTDETISWRDGPLIHIGPAAYSDMIRLGTNEFGVLFEAGDKTKSPYDRIDFVRFTLDELQIK